MFYLRAYFLILVTAAMLSACGGGDIQNSAATDTSQSGFEPKLPIPRAAAEITPVSTSSALASQAVNLQDAIAILKMIVGLEVNSSGQSVTAYQAYAADIDGNGKVELTDAISVLKRVVGLETQTANWLFFNQSGASAPVVSDKLKPGLAPDLTAYVTTSATTSNVGLVAVLRGDVVGSQFSYEWSLTSKPANSSAALTGGTAATPAFTADVVGSYGAALKISDGSSNTSSTTLTLTAAVLVLPGTPTIGAATPGDTTASIAFTPGSTEGQTVTYAASCTATGGTTGTGTGTASPVAVTGLTNGLTYSCTVTPSSSVGTGTASSAVSVVPVVAVPSAPTIGAATAGSTTASISFTAASTGATATSFSAICTPTNGSAVTGTGSASPISMTGLTNDTSYSCAVKAVNAGGLSAASLAISITPSSSAACTQASNFPDVSSRDNFIDYNGDGKTTWDSNATLQPKVTVSCANGVVSLASNGIPNFDSDGIGKLPTQVVAFAVNQVTWKFSQTPVVAASSTTLNLLGPIGVMVNGVQIYGPNEAPPDYTADPYKAGILNFCGGHVDKYHFHSYPECFFNQKTIGGVSSFLPDKTPGVVIGYALDGFPILSPYESCTTGAASCVNGVKEITSAYKYIGTGAYTKENAWTYNTYEANYNGSTLDKCNGKVGSNGSYAYYATRQFPYFMGCYKGTKTIQ